MPIEAAIFFIVESAIGGILIGYGLGLSAAWPFSEIYASQQANAQAYQTSLSTAAGQTSHLMQCENYNGNAPMLWWSFGRAHRAGVRAVETELAL